SPFPSTSPSATPPPCARWRFQSALSRLTVLVNRIPVRDGGSSLNPGPPREGTVSSRQRYSASLCQASDGAARRHAASSASSAKPPARQRRQLTAEQLLVSRAGMKQARRRATRLLASTDCGPSRATGADRKSTRLNSSHVSISYAVFCLKKKI